MVEIFLNVSDIPSFIDQNKWDFTTAFERLWKRCEPISLQTDEDKIQECFGKETLEIIKSTTIPMEQKKKKLKEFENVSSEITTKAESLINKTYGTIKEVSAIELFQKKENTVLNTQQKYYKNLFKTIGDKTWYIGGKMDGIQDDMKYVVEVKNRTKNFFTTVRDYEMTQIQLYMYLLNFNNAKLVEKHRDRIKITDIAKDEEYISDVLKNLEMFIENFCVFLNSPGLKKEYISSSFEMKKIFLRKLYLDKMN